MDPIFFVATLAPFIIGGIIVKLVLNERRDDRERRRIEHEATRIKPYKPR